MDEEELIGYKDISELKKELEGMKGKRDVSTKELYDAVQRLAQIMGEMLEVFGAAAEQMNLEERERESDAKKHEAISLKLDKVIEQNKTIAEGMVAIVDMVKEKMIGHARHKEMPKPEKAEHFFKPKPMPEVQEWQPRPEPVMPRMQQTMQSAPQMTAQATPMQSPMPAAFPEPIPPPDFGMEMPPMEPTPTTGLDFPEEPFPLGEEEGPKKKGLFGMFKK